MFAFVRKRAEAIAAPTDDPKLKRKGYFKAYNRMFIMLAVLVALVYLLCGREFVWGVDGLGQYYPFFIYEGQWIRDIFAGLVSGEGFEPQWWSWTLGYGTDVLATIDVFWNPLNLISAIIPERFSEFGYCLTIFIRMWMAGAFFSLYALHFKHGRFPVLLGALTYAFAVPALIGLCWPSGIDPLVLFPLVLLGAEKILDGERPTLFIVAVALAFLVNYYSAYAASIFLLFYAVARVFGRAHDAGEKVTPKAFLLIAVKFFAFYFIGVLISCVAVVPSVITLLQQNRATEGTVDVPILYEWKYYLSVLGGFLSDAEVGSDCRIGFGGFSFIACVMLFLQKKRFGRVKLAFIAMTACVLLPCAGSILNGFNYATNRWVWAYSFCISYIVVLIVPMLRDISKRERMGLAGACVVYAIILVVIPNTRDEPTMAAAAMMFVSLAGVLFVQLDRRPWIFRTALAGSVVLCLTVNAIYYGSSDEGGFANTSVPLGNAYSKVTEDSPNDAVTKITDDSFWRYDADPALENTLNSAWTRVRNDSLVRNIRGIDFYTSFYNQNIDQYHTELGIIGDDINFSYTNLGGRSMLEILNNVKYYLVSDRSTITSAYNYNDPSNVVSEEVVRGGNCKVYEGTDTLPLGYTYSKVITRSEYESLNQLQRQEALMQGVVVDDDTAAASDLETIEPESTTVTTPYTVTAVNGAEIQDGKIITTKNLASITLTFQGTPNSETYVEFENLSYTYMTERDLMSDEEWDQLSWYRKAYTLANSMNATSATQYFVYALGDKGSEQRAIKNYIPSYHLYGGKTDWSFNLGYSEEAMTSVTLTFSVAGCYTFDSIEVACQPMDKVHEQTDALKQDVLENTVVGKNSVTGTISLDETKRLYFSIPYGDGWTAIVDGEVTPIDKSNTAFMSLELEPGDHTIELHYFTPGLAEGGACTLVGLVLLAIVIVISRKNKRKDIDYEKTK